MSMDESEQRIPLSRPDISELEIQEVLSVLRTPTLSAGPKLREFEDRMASLLGVRHAVAVSSGTAGLHLGIRALGIGEGTEVLTTPFSFVASANAILYERSMPVFVDVDDRTLNLSPETVGDAIQRLYQPTDAGLVNPQTNRRLAGLLPVDVFGNPVDIEGFQEIAARYGLSLIEDSCEALGSELYSRTHRRWVKVGSQADISVFAFYPNKQITTGEGGLVATNDSALAARVRMGRNQGRSEGATWLHHETLGFNYRLDELSAALGVAQLKRFEELTRKRRTVAELYEKALAPIGNLRLPLTEPWARANWFVYVVRVPADVDRDALMRFLAQRGIESRAYFPAIHLQPFYQRFLRLQKGAFPVGERAAAEVVALPFFNDMTTRQVGLIARALQEGVHTCATARHLA
jgi:perosamine synthetase